jgi:hypothetical protein
MLLTNDKFVSLVNFFCKFLGKSIDSPPVSQQMSSQIAREVETKVQLDGGSGAPDLRPSSKHSGSLI